MTQNILGICRSQLSLWTKILLVLAIIIMAAGVAFIIRIHQGPIDLDFAKPQIEAALSNKEKGYDVKIGKLALTWPSLTDPLLLDLDGLEVEQEGKQGLSIENAAFSISGLGLLRGKIIPNYVLIEKPIIHLMQKNGRLSFFWQDGSQDDDTTPENSLKYKDIRKNVSEFLESLTNPQKTKGTIFSGLKEIELKKAIIKVEEFHKEQDDYLGIVDLKLEKNGLGLQGSLEVEVSDENGESTSFKSDIVYRKKQKDLTLTAALSGFNPVRFAVFFPEDQMLTRQNLKLNGNVTAAFDQDLKLQLAAVNVTVPEGMIDLPDIYDAPVPLKNIVFDAYLNRGDKLLAVKNFEATVNDIALSATGQGEIEKGLMALPLELKIADLPINNIPPIFPKSHLESSAGEWLTQKLSDGRLYDFVLKTDFVVTKNQETGVRDAQMTNTRVDFKTEGVTVKYSDTLMPVTEAKGVGHYENDSLTINGEYGKIGDIVGTNMELKMTDLSVEGGGLANITVKGKGPLKTALQYVSDEPIAVADKLGFDINQVDGTVDFNVKLQFPTVKDLPKEEVIVDLNGVVTDLKLPSVVKGLDLTGGPYDLGYKDGEITLKGDGALGGYPAKVDWFQYLDSTGKEFESKITASVSADEKLRDIFGIGLEDYISGSIPVDVVYTDYGAEAIIDVKGDLTPTALHIDPLNYKKEGGVAGKLSLKAYMQGEDLKRVDTLSLETKDFLLSSGNLAFRKLADGSTDIAKGSFPNAKLGETQADVGFEVNNEGVLKIVADGSVLDISGFLGGDKKEKENQEEEKPMIISASAPLVLAHEGEELKDMKVYLETNSFGDVTRLELDAKAGAGDMYMRFKPEEESGKRTFRMESGDAGYTLKAFGLYDKMRGGKMTIYGVPQGTDLLGNLYGTARIDNFKVKSTPVLAKLLGAMSLTGLTNLLNNEGVSFGRLESDFEWQFRKNGNYLVMNDGRTSGSSLGLTFDGIVNQGTNEMDIRGTIVPISGVNNVIGGIPVLGNILTGGSGSLIATTYTVSGQANDPKVSVNPLSMLAPGFLRKILFESEAPKLAPEKKVEKEKVPVVTTK